jgi:predicted RNA-binding Zn-ribbon protein involved in translation (DUF1610 family)
LTPGPSSARQVETVTQQYTFVCPACGERTVVDDPIRDQLEVDGCFMCGSSVGKTAFAPA